MALDFGAGCIGGAAGILAGYPLDTVKVKIQTQDVRNGRMAYKSTFDCLFKLIRADGVKSLYKGMSSPLLGVAGINAITFGAYGNVLRMLPDQDSISSITLAGASAGLIQSVVVSPMELVKTQMQVCGQNGIGDAVSTITRSAGMRGLARGLGITLTREVPAFGIYFGSYEIMIRNFGENTVTILGAGGMAGIFSWIFTYPQDVIKSRLQADGWGRRQKFRGPMHCLKYSVTTEGVSCLVRGVGSTIIRAFPMNAVTFGVYSYIMKRYGTVDAEDGYDTIKALNSSWEEDKLHGQIVATLATDGPNIVFVQEPVISPLSQARIYPEQMLWACPGAITDEDPWHSLHKMLEDGSFSNYCNFNQFTQRSPLNDLYNEPEVIPAREKRIHDYHEDFSCQTTLFPEQQRQNISRITTQDFYLPTNLLSNMKTKDRIYGFYYIVA